MLKLSYTICGVYDLILAIGLIFFSDFISSYFDISKPDNMLYVYTSGLFLLTVGYYLIFAAFHEPAQYLFIGFGSAIIRLSFSVIVIFLWLNESIEDFYLILVLTDSFTGILLLIPIFKTGEFSIRSLW
jgi:hypothetical protein